MNIVRRASCLWVVLLGMAVIGTVAAQPLYVQLDGRWYSYSASGSVPNYGLATMVAPGAQMSNCHRPDWKPMSFEGLWFYYGTGYAVVTGVQSLSYRAVAGHHSRRVIEVWSTNKDIVCAGEIKSPETGQWYQGIIFADGFDVGHSLIFTNGFEQ